MTPGAARKLRTRTVDWFRKMDSSGDGKISRAELKKGLKDMGCSLSASFALASLAQSDHGFLSLTALSHPVP